jgi:hypothetical protein
MDAGVETTQKRAETADPRLLAVDKLLNWLDLNEPSSLPAHISRVVAVRARKRLRAGLEPQPLTAEEVGAELEASGLRDATRYSGKSGWLGEADLDEFWERRQEQWVNFAGQQGLTVLPRLSYVSGPGGRGNKAEVRLLFSDVVPGGPHAGAHADRRDAIPHVRYAAGKAMPRFPVRWFASQHRWRFVSLGFLAQCAWAAALMGVLISPVVFALEVLSWPVPFITPHAALLILCLIAEWPLWLIVKPWVRAFDTKGLFIVPPFYLAPSAPFGQMVRAANGSGRNWQVRFVRYHASCPLCPGTVDLDWGEPDFPGRIVGRCALSMKEHVFAFDPVSMSGPLLRPELTRSRPPQVGS